MCTAFIFKERPIQITPEYIYPSLKQKQLSKFVNTSKNIPDKRFSADMTKVRQ